MISLRCLPSSSPWPRVLCLTTLATLTSCEKSSSPTKDAALPSEYAAAESQPPPSPSSAAAGVAPAAVGDPAPPFSLPDLSGNTVTLDQLKGKIVVLEWFNPDCPFVNAAHTRGSLVTAASDAQNEGVVWLAINSAAPGKQGHGVAANEEAKEKFHLEHPILLDESGQVGHAYGATNTPHLFVIDRGGKLVYAGAVDNSPDGEGESPEAGLLVSYVAQAIAQLRADQPVSVAETKAYGCSVKY